MNYTDVVAGVKENHKPGFFETAWRRLPLIRQRARERAAKMPKNIIRPDVDGPTLLSEVQKHIDYWEKAKELALHRELLEFVMQPDLVVSVNRLFSENATPSQVNFDRGVIYVFFSVFDKLAKAEQELKRFREAVTKLEGELNESGES